VRLRIGEAKRRYASLDDAAGIRRVRYLPGVAVAPPMR
jgi:hypothetical protein